MSKSIEIFIACHKQSEIPCNKIFKPIHVGSKNSNIKLQGLLRDDEGDNISEKNFSYCELTAQYWAWKHSQADYIGLCHYRRYLYLSENKFKNFTSDFRKQLYAFTLSPLTEKKYGLLDEENFINVIESNDIIVPIAQDLSKVYTPRGRQNSVYKHWIAHDQYLINKNDLINMLNIVKEYYPNIYKVMIEYLNDKYFYGFNTFIMTRELFYEMCNFEFDVLEKLEKTVNITKYNQQMSRIFGFMGEILSSTFFIYKKRVYDNIKLKEVPLIYFDETDPITNLYPEKESLVYVFDLEFENGFFLFPLIYTFLKHIDKNKKYEVVIIYDEIDKFYKEKYKLIFNEYINIVVKFKSTKKIRLALKENFENTYFYNSLFLQYILPNYTNCVYIKWNALIYKNIDDLFNLNNKKVIFAVKDVFQYGKHLVSNRMNNAYIKNSYNIYDIFSTNIMFINFSCMRLQNIRDFSFRVKKIKKDTSKIILNDSEFFSLLWKKEIFSLPMNYNYIVEHNNIMKLYKQEIPLYELNSYNHSKSCIKVLSYKKEALLHCNDINFYISYWDIVKKCDFSELFYSYKQQNIPNIFFITILKKIIDGLLPKNSLRRSVIKIIFPKNGILRKK